MKCFLTGSFIVIVGCHDSIAQNFSLPPPLDSRVSITSVEEVWGKAWHTISTELRLDSETILWVSICWSDWRDSILYQLFTLSFWISIVFLVEAENQTVICWELLSGKMNLSWEKALVEGSETNRLAISLTHGKYIRH